MRNSADSKIPRLFELLEEQHIKNCTLASAVGVSRNAVSEWKAGRCSPARALMPVIANYLGTSVAYLKGDSDVKYPPNAAPRPTSPVIACYELAPFTVDEQQLIKMYRNLPEGTKKRLLTIVADKERRLRH